MRELTYREKQHMAMVAMGMTSADISEALGKSKVSVDNCIKGILWSTGADSRAHAVALAFKRGYFRWNGEHLVINHET